MGVCPYPSASSGNVRSRALRAQNDGPVDESLPRIGTSERPTERRQERGVLPALVPAVHSQQVQLRKTIRDPSGLVYRTPS